MNRSRPLIQLIAILFLLVPAEVLHGQTIAINGTADAAYGPPVVVQNTQTGFGDSTLGMVDFANGSEIDACYARIADGNLYLLVAGNIESNYNKLEIFIDSGGGGQNRLLGNNANLDGNGLNRMGESFQGDGLRFDAVFSANYWIGVTGGGNPYLLFVNYAILATGGGAPGWYCGQASAISSGVLTGGQPGAPAIRATINNSNTAGVTGGTGVGSGAGVTTGVELAIPLSAIGSPSSLGVCIFVNGALHDFVSNQFLGSLGGSANLGEPRSVNLATIPGNQYFTVTAPQPSPIKINEIRIDQESVADDPDEYFELLGPNFASLDDYWYVVIGERAAPFYDGVIEAAINLSGYAISADSYFLAAEDIKFPQAGIQVDLNLGLDGLNFENNHDVTHLLVRGFIGGLGMDLDYDDDGFLDNTPWTSVEDCVAVVENSNPDISGNRIYCATRVGPAVGVGRTFAPAQVYRSSDGGGTWQMGPFVYKTASRDTPGFTNVPATGACCNGGACTPNLTQSVCEAGGGVWAGAGTLCSPNICVGVCCVGASCSLQTRGDCISLGGFFRGAGTTCAEVTCPGPVAPNNPTGLKINEIWASDPVTDDVEFIELFLGSAAAETRGGPVSLAGISLVVVDGDTFGDPTSRNYKRVSFQVDFDSGDTIAAPGHFLMASGCVPRFNRTTGERGCTPPVLAFSLGSLENHSQTYALVRTQDIAYCQDPANPTVPPAGCQGHVNRHRLTDASAALITANIIDSVATRDTNAGDQSYFNAPVVQDGIYQATQMQRTSDGTDSDSRLDWDTQWQVEAGDPNDASSPGGTNVPGTGACCTGDNCAEGVKRTECIQTTGGVYRGNNSSCASVSCVGACCLAGSCIGEMNAASCAAAGGAYMGDGITCAPGLCTPIDIPAAEARPPHSPVILDQLVVLSEDDVVSNGGIKHFNVRRGAEGLTILGRNAQIEPILSQIVVGDTISIVGTTDEHFGLFQLTGEVAPLKVLSVAHTGLSPVFDTLTPADFQPGAPQAEVSESSLVRLNCISFVKGGTGERFAADTWYLATDGPSLVRVFVPGTAAGLVGALIPEGARDLRGLFWQEDHFTRPEFGPMSNGYRLSMRSGADLLATATCGAMPVGACCAPMSTCVCSQSTQSQCLALGGQYIGDGSPCLPFTLCSSNRLTGDIDGDGDVDLTDMQLFVPALLGFPQFPEHVVRADMNCDTKSNSADIAMMIDALTP